MMDRTKITRMKEALALAEAQEQQQQEQQENKSPVERQQQQREAHRQQQQNTPPKHEQKPTTPEVTIPEQPQYKLVRKRGGRIVRRLIKPAVKTNTKAS